MYAARAIGGNFIHDPPHYLDDLKYPYAPGSIVYNHYHRYQMLRGAHKYNVDAFYGSPEVIQ